MPARSFRLVSFCFEGFCLETDSCKVFHCQSEPKTLSLSLGSVFQVPVLCRLQASFRDLGQNSALRRPVDSATCGPELKQSLGLKSACKEPPNGFKGAPSQQLRRPATRKPALAGF